MVKERHSAEVIVAKLRPIEVLCGHGSPTSRVQARGVRSNVSSNGHRVVVSGGGRLKGAGHDSARTSRLQSVTKSVLSQ